MDVLNRTMPDMASLCQILISPAQVKQKMLFSDFLVTSTSLQKKFEIRMAKNVLHYHVCCTVKHRNLYMLTQMS